MSIKLSWVNRNVNVVDSIKIYRSLSAIDIASPGTALAVLPGTALEYTDTTVTRNTLYHYVVETVQGGSSVFGAEFVYGYYPDTGPGPKVLKRGDWSFGYFGPVTVDDFISTAQFISLLREFAGLSSFNYANTFTPAFDLWYKFVLNGKIIFMPRRPSTQHYWQQYYNWGLVYGVDGMGSAPAGTGATFNVNQKRVITVGDYSYMVRMPTASDVATNVYVPLNSVPSGEFTAMAALTVSGQTGFDRRLRLNDGDGYSALPVLSQHWAAASVIATIPGLAFGTITQQSYNTTTGALYWPMLELQF